METFMKLGQQCGLQGQELLDFVEGKEQIRKAELRQQQDAEREERNKEREDREKEREAREKEIEDREKEREEREKEREERDKEREHEKELIQLGHSRSVPKGIPGNVPNMPVFRADSDELDAYIVRFERHATLQKWPPEYWALSLIHI